MPNPPGGGHDDVGLNLKYATHTRWAVNAAGLGANGVSLGGAPGGQIAELVAASEINGVSMDAADELYDLFDPNDMDFDLTQDIQARLLFIDTVGTKTGIIWDFAMKGVASGVAIGDAKVTPDGSCTFATIASSATANALAATEWAKLGLTSGVLSTKLIVETAITLTSLGTAAADTLILVGLQLRGARKITNDSGRQST